ncbi:MAG TPA: hypothetical protein VF491_26405 [Vicinamibacterales bacterium]|jgi:hypothetical protein
MEQKERIEQLKAELRRLGGDQVEICGVDRLPPEVAEEFLKRVIAFEESEGDAGKGPPN